jgi:hypothetical protein
LVDWRWGPSSPINQSKEEFYIKIRSSVLRIFF